MYPFDKSLSIGRLGRLARSQYTRSEAVRDAPPCLGAPGCIPNYRALPRLARFAHLCYTPPRSGIARPTPHTAIRRSGVLWAREAVAHPTMRAHSTKRERIQHTASIGAGEPSPAEARQEISVGILKIFWRNCLSSNAMTKNCQNWPYPLPPFPASASLPRSQSNHTNNLGCTRAPRRVGRM